MVAPLGEDDEEVTCQIVTTMRQNALKNRVSKESPVGRAVLGRRVGDRVTVEVNERYSYDIVIRAIEPGEDIRPMVTMVAPLGVSSSSQRMAALMSVTIPALTKAAPIPASDGGGQ